MLSASHSASFWMRHDRTDGGVVLSDAVRRITTLRTRCQVLTWQEFTRSYRPKCAVPFKDKYGCSTCDRDEGDFGDRGQLEFDVRYADFRCRRYSAAGFFWW